MCEKNSPQQALDETFREYAWKYFELHADQRLRAFHFYITLSSAVIGGFLLLLRYGQNHKWMAVLGLLLVFFSFVFSKLDLRTRNLINHAETALRFLDDQRDLSDVEGQPHPLKLFSRDDHLTRSAKLWPLLIGHFSYSRCFRWVFTVFAITGVVTAAACLIAFPV